jgi:hypothetical protein
MWEPRKQQYLSVEWNGKKLSRKILSKRTVDGYMGTMNSESVAVGNMPTAFLALIAELAAAGLPVSGLLALELCPWWRVPTTAPTTAPATIRTPTGTPNLIHLLIDFFAFAGAA